MAASPTAITASYLIPPRSAFAISSHRLSSLRRLNLSYLQRRANAQTPRRVVVRAARIESGGVELGARAPDFELPEPLTGNVWRLDDFELYPCLLKGLAVVAISSNSVVTHPQDGPEFMAEDAKMFKYPFPYLYDESQEVAKEFGAVCTPEFFLYKKDGRRPFELVYHGQFDDSRPSNNTPVTGRDLSLAIDLVLSCQPIPTNQKPSVGCSIKWHPGTES
ncbi:uncharacterized protein BNAC05G16600D isoform X3 [Brassica napus]|uniref:uncharacterized protein BNAC05G16600D isoform X3 n=1 Tax=Brassica napus TaxID=3708 RepID=UPI000BBE3FA0|nr:uncharacterized protein BNAC05G16600D isoform X3 [Brassica napus]XP_048612739.1 uncharacterized protein BNAC05G16600D isoform X3 [Brassica napus]